MLRSWQTLAAVAPPDGSRRHGARGGGGWVFFVAFQQRTKKRNSLESLTLFTLGFNTGDTSGRQVGRRRLHMRHKQTFKEMSRQGQAH